MHNGNLLILKAADILALLAGCENQVLEVVQRAYEAHQRGNSSLPHSLFLRFPENPQSRIIALPAFLGEEFQTAGIKWVSSFPDNLERGQDRASAVVILNSPTTGKPEAILEGSIISARRTAASAALAARHLHGDGETCAGLIGCGPINFEIARFLLVACPRLRALRVFDLQPGNALRFKEKCRELDAALDVTVAADVQEIIRECRLISLATTATTPHLANLAAAAAGTTILHISLRDLAPAAILASDNIVDDIDHVCRAATSVHLTEQQVGNRDFIRGTLAEVTSGAIPARKDADSMVVFSPFGLGVLDLAVSRFVVERARAQGAGIEIEAFLPAHWLMRQP